MSKPSNLADDPKLYFSDFFQVSSATVKDYGAFNVSLVADLPLFIDPFLLFNSRKEEYRALHDQIMKYLRFLRDKSADQLLDEGLLRAWYTFPEVRQNWLGFTIDGNRGSGLGIKFAGALRRNLAALFPNFGKEQITRGSHLEKLCLIESGVGRDNISDLAVNLVKGFLLRYTETFAKKYINEKLCNQCAIEKDHFNYQTEVWERGTYHLPSFRMDYVLLTPKDMLTKDDSWINRRELIDDFQAIPDSIPDGELRALINNYFRSVLPTTPSRKEIQEGAMATIRKFPQIIDYYIRKKEIEGDRAIATSTSKVQFSEQLYLIQFGLLASQLARDTEFYQVPSNTYKEALQRLLFLKDVIENKGGHKLFYVGGQPVQRESDIHIMYRLTWYATSSDVSREVNDGRGPADFKISRGAKDKSIVEFKLASNPQLKRNLQHQTKVYEMASDASQSVKAIIFFTAEQLERVTRILKELELTGREGIVLIDARMDNKPSGSKAA